MTRSMLAQTIASIGFLCAGIAFPVAAFSADQTVDDCSRELLLAYFPEPFVKETLKKFNVPEAKWDALQKELANKDKEVIKIVEEKAAQMDPNPLKDPQARQAAVKLFRDTLLQVFTDVMKSNGITDEKQIQSMLDDVQQQKAQRFAKCMQKQEIKTPEIKIEEPSSEEVEIQSSESKIEKPVEQDDRESHLSEANPILNHLDPVDESSYIEEAPKG